MLTRLRRPPLLEAWHRSGRRRYERGDSAREIRRLIREAGDGYAYHLFLSHVRNPDAVTAQRVRRRLQRVARRWWERRQMSVFLDVDRIAADTDLAGVIRTGLRTSAGLVLLARPLSAKSHWVTEELRWWRENRTERPIIVRTGGEIHWDGAAGDFDWPRTTALSREVFAGWYDTEPLWVDLARPEQVDRAAVAVAASLLRMEPITLAGEERRRQHRQLALAATAVLLVAALGATSLVYADSASRARARAAIEAQDRTAEQLVRAAQTAGVRTDVALLLHSAAYRVAPGRQAHTLWQRAMTYPGLRRVLRMPPDVTVDTVREVAFSPDGRWLAAATSLRGGIGAAGTSSADGSLPRSAVLLWPASGDGIGTPVPVPAGAVAATSLAYTPDGTALAVGDPRGAVTLVGVPSNTTRQPPVLATLPAPAGSGLPEVDRLSFAPDGRSVAVSHADGTTRVWDRHTARPLTSFGGRRTVFAPAGATISTLAPDGRVVVRRTSDYAVASTITLPDVAEIAYRPDGRQLVLGTEAGTPGVWLADLPAGRPRPVSGTLPGTVLGLGDGDVLTNDSGVVVTDAGTATPRTGWRPPGMSIRSLAFRPGGTVYAAAGHWLDQSLRGGITLWDADPTAVPVTRVSAVTAPGNGTPQPGMLASTALSTSPDGRLAAGVNGRQVTVWSTVDGTARHLTFPVTAIAPAPDGGPPGRLAFSSDSATLAVTGPDGSVTALATGPDDTGPLRARSRLVPGTPARDLAFGPDGDVLAVATGDGVQLWDLARQRLVRTLTHPEPPADVTAVAFDRAGRLFATDGRRLVQWDVRDGRAYPLPALDGAFRLTRLAVAPGGTLLAGTTDGGTIVLWDLAAGRRLDSVLTAPVPVRSLTFGGAGGLTLSATGSTVVQWNLDPEPVLEWICDVVQRDLETAEWQTYGAGAKPRVCPAPPR
ncbi:WD40 repeat domain-containing protein [Micromonospora sp. NPDC050397]|uniref:WD40 repeat domain-containing protein n=1 Tax=Micromonospora sp. NPDC050397 TaxID=3364279 RepID=UPI00384B04E2